MSEKIKLEISVNLLHQKDIEKLLGLLKEHIADLPVELQRELIALAEKEDGQ
ncbi:MAG: hypothetical protein MJK15_02995 [Colwellia sp.]|nr:hypothetical protein [Colwellia sp.]